MAQKTDVLFDERFLDRHAGSIISNTDVAIVELVANSWDAYATKVDIEWPDRTNNLRFSIKDNGKGLTATEFKKRWRVIDYNRLSSEGSKVSPPDELPDYPDREAYGRNGRGWHAAFRFSDTYTVTTCKNGMQVKFQVQRGLNKPFDIELIDTLECSGHGTEIVANCSNPTVLTAAEAREIIGTRFLADPNFIVSVDGVRVTFEDIPPYLLSEKLVEVPPFGSAKVIMIDSSQADRTTRQHGIAWHVRNRLVGSPGWVGFDDERILDGRTSEAKRFTFIIKADYLDDSVSPDWRGFDPSSKAWIQTKSEVHDAIKQMLSGFTAGRRIEAKAEVRAKLASAVNRMAPVDRERWSQFVDNVIDNCPTISTSEVEQVAGILANLEISNSKYGLIRKLHDMTPGDFDELHQILQDWTVRSAKLALDEIQNRLKLIEELDQKLRDKQMDEVGDLQPLFERSLWVFGPEFESIEFTSNRGMTEVIRSIFGKNKKGSRLRPDFVALPDGSVGFYSRDAHDFGHEVDGVSRLVIAEIKKVGVPIGTEQKDQVWKYAKELLQRGLITNSTQVTGFVLGSAIEDAEASDRTERDGRVVIRPMSYNTFIRRAEKRMLGLRDKLQDAPFLKEHGIDGAAFLEGSSQPELI